MGGERAVAPSSERAHFLLADEEIHAVPPVGRAVAPRPAGGEASLLPKGGSRLRAGIWQRLYLRAAAALAKDAARGAAFLCLPVLLAGGASFYFGLTQEPGTVPLVLILVFLAVSAFLARRRSVLFVPFTACFVFALGVAAAKLETWRAATPVIGSEITTRITGRLVRLEDQASGRVRLTVDVLATERPRLRYAPERVRVTARSVPDGLQPGDGVAGLVRLMPPPGPVRPGSYDFGFTSYFRGLGAIGFFMSDTERVELDEPLPIWTRPARWLESLRLALAERIRSHVAAPEGEVVVAMIVGFRPGIPEETNEWLRRSGLAHILSISGLHMALVAMTVMTMLRTGAALFPGFSSRVPVKKYAAAAALAFCTLYLFISGGDVAAERSYIMLAVMLAALLFDRAAITMRNVAIAALVIVALSPHEVVGPSFQMSFAATAALVAGYAAWNHWRRGREFSPPPSGSLVRRAVRAAFTFLAGLAATSLIAGTATTLYSVWHFQRAAPMGLPANLAAMPLVSLVVMPFAVFSILAMPFGLDGFFLKIMVHGIAGVIAIARWFSEHSPVDAVGLVPLSAVLSLTVALIIPVVSTTWMRLAALPFLVLGLTLIADRQLPDVLVAEDARLVGVGDPAGRIAVNRSRPNGFTIDDWTRSLMAEEVLKPQEIPARPSPDTPALTARGFVCGDGLCLARHESGAVIAYAQNRAAAQAVCGAAVLIVLDDATAGGVCGAGEATVITKRVLARKGAAAIRLVRDKAAIRAEATFAVEEPFRPWHEYRAWSRAARGLPPYRREDGGK